MCLTNVVILHCSYNTKEINSEKVIIQKGNFTWSPRNEQENYQTVFSIL